MDQIKELGKLNQGHIKKDKMSRYKDDEEQKKTMSEFPPNRSINTSIN